MRPPLLLAPLALLATAASACAETLSTPSTPLDGARAEDVRLRAIVLPARAEALRRWTLPADDPWAPYAKYTLLTSLHEASGDASLPDVETLGPVQRARAAALRLGASGLPDDTLWVVDTRGAASVAFGTALSSCASAGPVSLVPTFNNWPAHDEVVPAEETLAALATMVPATLEDRGAGSHPIFLLDAWRLAHRYDEPDDDAYDNRYALSASDFPPAAALLARGIRRVVYVVDTLAETKSEEDDLNPVFLAWSLAGIPIDVTDLDRLAQPVPEDPGGVYVGSTLVIRPRTTVLGDPSFYLRARGGFGGVLARPSVVSLGHGGWGGFGGWGGGHGGGG